MTTGTKNVYRDSGDDQDDQGHCVSCGRKRALCDNQCARTLDPARFCPQCGRRMTVRVTPASYVAKCRDCGEYDPSA